MIAFALFHMLPVIYLRGVIIALLIGGLCYGRLNAWRQTNHLIEAESQGRMKGRLSESERKKEEENGMVAVPATV